MYLEKLGELYKEIVRLLGGLSLFKNNLEIPNYDHNDLTTVFNTLEQKLQLVVHRALPENIVKLPLTKQTDSLYLIDHIEPHLFTKYQFYLAVKMSNHDLTWINRFPQQIKIACQTDIQAVIGSAIPTIPLQHLQRPPNHLPIKNDYEYFQIEQQNEYWHRIAETNNLAIFVSYEFTEVQVEMVAIV